ncbi:MAG: SoxR reducing system RseC family protein [Bacteroidales bacterium]|jgi:sigma-E factor negative regulatory protein RseC|nr:SoxR reducing system RseC family protein [Bacteroidales bacterium]
MSEKIKHKGRVIEIEGDRIVVQIISESMCASCHAKGACTMNDKKEKNIVIEDKNASNYSIGQEVICSMERKMGFSAVMIGFFYPFLLLISSIILSLNFITPNNEVLSSIIAIAILGIYYLIIYFLREKIGKKFHFTIESPATGI